MAAINFPNSPTSNQLFSAAGRTWRWDSAAELWDTVAATSIVPTAHAASHQSGGTDQVQLAQSQITGLPLFNVLSPLDTQTLVYNQSTQRWVNSLVSGESFSPFLMMGA
jgi:hypothetical protein